MRKRLLSTVASPVARDLIARVSHIPACTSANSGTAFAFYLSRGLTTSAPQPLGQSLRSGAAGKATELARTSVLLCEGPKGLTTFAARWQDSAVSPTGLNPLMQTPGPAIQLPTPALDSAVPQTAQAVLRKTKISPKKLNEFAKLVRRLHIEDALVQCQVAPNKAAKLCYKLLLSAKDNAIKDKGLDANKLVVNRAFVGQGQHFKRLSMHARGRSGTRHKYHSHLTIILAEGPLKRVTQFRPPNAQWNANKRFPASMLPSL